MLLIGLAVGVDYSMFYLRREREERAAGRSERAAIEAAAATSGRSVLISGLTVMVAMAGMFLTGDTTFASFGVATILVVAIAVLGSLTVLPALLSKLGDRVDRGRVPFVGRLAATAARAGSGARSSTASCAGRRCPRRSRRRPARRARPPGAPAAHGQAGRRRPSRRRSRVVKTYNRMQQAFPGTALPANVVVKAPNVNAPAVREAIARLEQRALASGRAHEPITVDVNNDAHRREHHRPDRRQRHRRRSRSPRSRLLREQVIPETVGALPNAEAGVTGLDAQWKDSTDQMKSNLPPRRRVRPRARVRADAGRLPLDRGRGQGDRAQPALGRRRLRRARDRVPARLRARACSASARPPASDPVVPLLLFVILFGLSMDYHVLILSRIRERFDRGATMDEAVSQGIKSTAGVVTSAAVVMVGVFSIFATLSMLMFKQFGVGLAAAILIDATIVRARAPAGDDEAARRVELVPPARGSSGFRTSSRRARGHGRAGSRAGPRPRARTPRRRPSAPPAITGLLLIAVLALGLAYLRFASGRQRGLRPGRREGRPADPALRATTAPSRAATPPTAARSSCPRTAPTRSRG